MFLMITDTHWPCALVALQQALDRVRQYVARTLGEVDEDATALLLGHRLPHVRMVCNAEEHWLGTVA